jgi:tRNA threonylcarbamoyladenosine biosynthesis protein TsaE
MQQHLPIVKTIAWPDELATARFAQDLAKHPALRHAVLTLHGDLGAGKTTFARHLLQALGVTGRIKSPTYAVVEPYALPANADAPAVSIWHCDFYRFNDPQEWEDAGFRDIFASPGLKLVEWPDKAGTYLPTADLQLHIALLPSDARSVKLIAHSACGAELIT